MTYSTMKIKDIKQTYADIRAKIHAAIRIYNCTPEIKKAIKKWKNDGCLPQITISLENGNKQANISSTELVEIYGLSELNALLMLDELVKAQRNGDKNRLSQLLRSLIAGRHVQGFTVTDEMLEGIKKNSPDVWKEYERLSKKVEEKEKELEKEYVLIAEENI